VWKRQEAYIEQLEEQLAVLRREGEERAREGEERHKLETSRRENLLVMRLTAKEQELQAGLNIFTHYCCGCIQT
jgi:hypothetical protein